MLHGLCLQRAAGIHRFMQSLRPPNRRAGPPMLTLCALPRGREPEPGGPAAIRSEPPAQQHCAKGQAERGREGRRGWHRRPESWDQGLVQVCQPGGQKPRCLPALQGLKVLQSMWHSSWCQTPQVGSMGPHFPETRNTPWRANSGRALALCCRRWL